MGTDCSRAEEKYLIDCCVPKYRTYADVHVWACIGGDGSKGPLFIWDRKLYSNFTSTTYIQRIFPIIESFIREHELFRIGNSNSFFIQDNASPHRADATKAHFHAKDVKLMFWPANSSDLNPIENV